ncbi:MAG: hypothetical protein ABIT01_01990 [Thermoanaerobaculia bacterium]
MGPNDAKSPESVTPNLIACRRHCHTRKLPLTTAEVGDATSHGTAPVYTFQSKCGILPKPLLHGAGCNPRWSACTIARWLNGTLPPSVVTRKFAGKTA